ncbi:MAG: hypothetical protein HC907_35615 [Richelia sp. SM1_7_0]|nr:hypothetical protein [Richelia sp. SM1_7_0]
MANFTSLIDYCPSCGSYKVLESLEPETSIHYGRVTCSECGRFIRWMPKPKVPDISIAKLLHGTGLEPWERKFLKTIACRHSYESRKHCTGGDMDKINPVPSGRGTG